MKELLRNKRLLIITVILLIVVALPFLLVIFNIPVGYEFDGRLGQNDGDYFVYFSQMEQARNGSLSFYNLFTTQPHEPVIFNPVWLVMGWLGLVTNLSNYFIFHIVRLMLVPFFVFSAWRCIKYFFIDSKSKYLLLIFILIGGGLSGYASTTDASPLNAMLFSPHLILSLIFIIHAIINFDKYINENKKIHLLISGLLSFFLSLFHPYQISALITIFGIFILLNFFHTRNKNLLSQFAKWFLFLIPVILYYWWMFRVLPFGDQWLSQSDELMMVRNPWEMIISFLPIFILAMIGLCHEFNKKNSKILLIGIWATVPFFMMSIPAFFRMRTTGGIFLALAILGGIGVVSFTEQIKKNIILKIITHLMIIILICIGSFNIWLGILNNSYNIKKTNYISDNQLDVFNWIKNNTNTDDSFLASWHVSNLITSYCERRVYIGHGIQTPDALNSYEKVLTFFNSSTTGELRKNFLNSNNINYLWYSEWEKKYGEFNPDEAEYLTEVYTNMGISIYYVSI